MGKATSSCPCGGDVLPLRFREDCMCSGQKSVLFGKKLGRYLRHMSIICRQLTSHTCDTMLCYLETFLDTLTGSGPPVLRSLEIEGLELEFWRFGNLRDQVASTLIKFFRSQNNLKKFRMPNAQFALVPGVEILEAIADGNGANLETLLFEFFFQSRLAVFQNNRFNLVMEKFSNLHTVALNYCCLREQLVTAWAKTLRGTLKELFIKCHDNEPYAFASPDHVISNSAWSSLANACPQLQVDLCVFGFGHSREVLPLLASAIPLRSFNFFSGYDNGLELGLSAILTHLVVNYHRNLRSLELEFDNYHDNVDDALVTTVTRCRLLTSLKVKAHTDIQVARYICRLLEEGRTSLINVDLMLCDISPLQIEYLRDLRDDMSHVMQGQGIDLVLRDDLYSDA